MVELPFLTAKDRAPVTMGIAVAFLVAKIIAVRAQPLNKGDVAEACDLAESLIEEVERRHGTR